MNKLKIRLLISKHRKRIYKPRIWFIDCYVRTSFYIGEKYV